MPDPTMLLAILIVIVGCLFVTVANLSWKVKQLPEWQQNERVSFLDRRMDGLWERIADDREGMCDSIERIARHEHWTRERVKALEMGRRGLVEMCEPVKEGRPE